MSAKALPKPEYAEQKLPDPIKPEILPKKASGDGDDDTEPKEVPDIIPETSDVSERQNI